MLKIKETRTMQRVYEFLDKSGIYYLATAEGDQPRVRPFGTVNIYENRLYIQTGAVKAVSRQMHENPKVEICAFHQGSCLRVAATAVLDESLEAQKSLLDRYPSLAANYKAGDGNNEVWYLKDATATISTGMGPDAKQEVIHF